MPARGTTAKQREEDEEFSSEAELVGQLVKLLPGPFREWGERFHIAVEVSVGRGIADIVAVVPGEAAQVQLWPLSIRECVVLAALRRGGGTRIDLLEGRCGLPRRSLRNGTLKRLEEAGLVKRGNGGRVQLAHDWLKSVRVIAFEAKLSAWRDAVRQAQEYLRYADEAYVALPRATVGRETSDVFSGAGVGLLQVGGGEVEVTVRAVDHGKHDWRREFAVSRLLTGARVLDERPDR